MSTNGCKHTYDRRETEQRWNAETKEWETWLVTYCAASGCGAKLSESRQS